MLNVELPEPGSEAELKEHAAPEGSPEEQVRSTAPLNPFTGLIETVEAIEAPAETVTGEVAEIEKFPEVAVVCTVRLTDVLWLKDPEVPVIVTL
jgi:hypothetical protein